MGKKPIKLNINELTYLVETITNKVKHQLTEDKAPWDDDEYDDVTAPLSEIDIERLTPSLMFTTEDDREEEFWETITEHFKNLIESYLVKDSWCHAEFRDDSDEKEFENQFFTMPETLNQYVGMQFSDLKLNLNDKLIEDFGQTEFSEELFETIATEAYNNMFDVDLEDFDPEEYIDNGFYEGS